MADLKRVVELVVEDELSAGMAAATASIEKFDAQVRRSTPTAEGLAARLDHLTRAEANLAAVVDRNATRRRTLDEGLRQNTISIDQHTRSLQTMAAEQAKAEATVIRMRTAAAGAAQGADSLASSTQQVNHQMRALTQQMPDVVSGLLTGQQPFMILVQQGGQVVQVMGGVGAALKAVATYLGGPWVLAGVAAAATMGAMVARSAELANQQRQLDVALRAVGATGVTSAAALAEYAKQMERAGVAKDAAMSTVQGLARNPTLTQQDIQRAAQLAPDLAAGLGIEVPDAAKRLADALAGGYEGLKKLDDALNLLTVDQRNAARVMLEHGETGKAADLVFESLTKRIGGLHRDSLSPMGAALRDVSNAWAGFMNEVAKSAPVIAAVQLLGQSVQGLSMIVRGDTGSRPAPPGQPGDAGADQLAAAVSQREGLLQRYTAARQGQGPALTPPMLAQMESEIGRLTVQIDDLRAKQSALAASLPPPGVAVTTAARPDVVTDRNEGLPDPTVMRQRAQMKEALDATEAERRQIDVLKAGLPVRDAVRARIEATSEATRRGLEGAARTLFIETKVQAATLGAADAAGQHLVATQREAVGLLAVAQAADRGRAAMIVARAATEAHEKAATEAGVAEGMLRDAIVNRAAAQEAEKGAERILELREQADAIAAMIEAEQKSPQAAYWAKVDEKVRLATQSLEAHRDAATDPRIKAALDAEISRIRQLIPQVERLGAAYDLVREISTDAKQIALLEKQIELVGKSADERERELSIFKAQQAVKEKGGDLANPTAQEQAFIASKTRIADLGSELRRHQSLYDEIANSATRSFETVGDAITDAFVKGQGASVSWGSVTRGVISTVIQKALQLSVVNPLLNGLFGGERASIWTALLPSGGAAGAAGGGLGDLLGLSSFLPKDGILGSLGLGNSLSGLGASIFGTPGVSAATASLFGDVTGIGVGAMAGSPGMLGTFGTSLMGGSSLTLGGAFSGIGMGMGAGSLINSLLGRSSAQQTNGMIGSALGSIGGFLIGGPIGGLIGGALGGFGGGLFGPGQPNHGFGFAVRANGGNDGWATGTGLQITDPSYDEQGRAVFEQGTQLVNSLNEFLAANKLTVYGARAIGGSRHGMGGLGYGEAASFQELLASFTFGSSANAGLNTYLNTQRFDDPAKLAAAVQGFSAAEAAIAALTAEAIPAFTQQMTAVNEQFDAAVEQARKYGLSETALATARAKALAALEAQRTETLRQTRLSLGVRYLTAIGREDDAALLARTETAAQEVRALTESLTALGIAAADQVNDINTLLAVQAAEQQKILEDQTKAAREEWTRFGQSIRGYLDGLASGTAAGASPTDRLAAAQATFTRDRTLAFGGDRDALGRITQSADALLGAGRDVYASGGGYQALLSQVVTGLSSLPVVQSYDAAMTAALEAIAGTISGDALLTSLSSNGNIVQISGGASLQPVVNALGDVVDSLDVGMAGVWQNTANTVDTLLVGFDGVWTNTANTVDTLVSGFAGLGEITLASAEAVVTAMAAQTKVQYDLAMLLAAGNSVVATNIADGAAVNTAAQAIIATAIVNGFAAQTIAAGVNATALVDGFAANTTALGAIMQGMADIAAVNTYAQAVIATAMVDGFAANTVAQGAIMQGFVDGFAAVTNALVTGLVYVGDMAGAAPATANDNGGVINSLALTNRYLAAVAWNTRLLAGETGLLIAPDPAAAEPPGRPRVPTMFDTAFASGGAFDGGALVDSPTFAPMALFGEAGPEAIMPLRRGPGGRLGVSASSFDLSPLLREMESLRDEVAALREMVAQVARAEMAAERAGVDDVVEAVNGQRRLLERVLSKVA